MFRPLKQVEKKVRNDYELAIFSKYKKGLYVGKDQAGEILKFSFTFYEELLVKHLKKIASIDLIAFLLGEYDNYCELSFKYRYDKLTQEEINFWDENGQKSKRAIKYLSEQVINYLPNEVAVDVDIYESISYCIIAAEEMTMFYISSDLAYRLSPTDCVIEVKDKGNYNFLEFKPNNITNIINDTKESEYFIKRDKYISKNNIQMPFDVTYQAKVFDDVFLDAFNLSYTDTIDVIRQLILICNPKIKGVNSCGFYKESMIAALVEDRKELNVTKKQIDIILSGFSLSSSNLYQRKIFSPKQEYRSFKRAFFEIETSGGVYILFSKKMAEEALTQLQLSACFDQLPAEWLKINSGISKKLALQSNATGKWFEHILSNEYQLRGINFVQSIKKLKLNGENIHIPECIGEIDFLAIVGSELHVIECKFVQFASEPRHYLDDKSKFTKGDKSYSAKFIRKVNWVTENIDAIKQHLSDLGIQTCKIESIRPYMVTFFPTIAKGLIDEYKCIDFIEYFESAL